MSRLVSGVVALLLLLVPRVLLLHRSNASFDADEALTGIMAGEFLHGRWQLFLPGQAYLGSLQALVAAPLLAVFGEHPWVVRLSPALWIVPGLLALRALDRKCGGPLGSGRGFRLLAAFWLVPPAVLYFSGLKCWGGHLEAMVLGLWAMVFLWDAGRAGAIRGRGHCRYAAGGLLLGLAVWTDDQALLFLPIVLICLFIGWVREPTHRVRHATGFFIGSLIGYVPLWIPRLAGSFLGPPGLESAAWQPDFAAPFSMQGLRVLIEAWPMALTTKGLGQLGVPGLLYCFAVATATVAAFVLRRKETSTVPAVASGKGQVPQGTDSTLIGGAHRRHSRWRYAWQECPSLILSLALALAAIGGLLVSPGHTSDPQWSRYTLFLCPLLVVGPAYALSRLNERRAWAMAGPILLLSLVSQFQGNLGWITPDGGLRARLARQLEEKKIYRVATDWQLAYFLRFVSGDRVLCSSYTPPRYPEVNAAIRFSRDAWVIRPCTKSLSDHPHEGPPEEAFHVKPIADSPPPEVASVFLSLDQSRTLYADFEPFPLFELSEIQRDWRGWPYRRNLERFDAIIWDPGNMADPTQVAEIERRLDALVQGGGFALVAEWSGRLILRRVENSPR